MSQRSTDTQRLFLVERSEAPVEIRLSGPATEESWEDNFHTAPDYRTPGWRQGETGFPPMRLEFVPGEDGAEVVELVAEVFDGWRLTVELDILDGVLEPVEIRLRRQDGPPVGSGARMVRKLGLGRLLKTAEAWMQDPWFIAYLGERWNRQLKRPGSGGRPDVFYAQWARRYSDALAAEERRPVHRLVAEATERGEMMTGQQVRWYLTEARSRGLLTEAPDGRAGGELTELALELLAKIDEAEVAAQLEAAKYAKPTKKGKG